MCGTSDVECSGAQVEARWSHVRQVHELDLCGSCLRVLPRNEIGGHIAQCLRLDVFPRAGTPLFHGTFPTAA